LKGSDCIRGQEKVSFFYFSDITWILHRYVTPMAEFETMKEDITEFEKPYESTCVHSIVFEAIKQILDCLYFIVKVLCALFVFVQYIEPEIIEKKDFEQVKSETASCEDISLPSPTPNILGQTARSDPY